MKKLLVVCGPTAAGKTTLAIKLAGSFNGEVVSADSRQVFKGLDIGVGKDLPKGARRRLKFIGRKLLPYYVINGVKIWGYDLVDAKSDFSVGEYASLARKMTGDIWKREKLPILAGGTGLYVKAVVEVIPTINIPQNKTLRKSLASKTVGELFEHLATVDPIRAASLNFSDKKNSRRLIRAIEVGIWKVSKKRRKKITPEPVDILKLGLKVPESKLFRRIQKRVEQRLEGGFKQEVVGLIKKGVSVKHYSMQAIGYKEMRDHIGGKTSLEELKKAWVNEERKYAKRQMTWFKKDKGIVWFDPTQNNYLSRVEKEVGKWYSAS